MQGSNEWSWLNCKSGPKCKVSNGKWSYCNDPRIRSLMSNEDLLRYLQNRGIVKIE